MENDACVEQKNGDNTAVDQVKQQPVSTAPFRYTKVREIPLYDSHGIVKFFLTIITFYYAGGASGNKRIASL